MIHYREAVDNVIRFAIYAARNKRTNVQMAIETRVRMCTIAPHLDARAGVLIIGVVLGKLCLSYIF